MGRALPSILFLLIFVSVISTITSTITNITVYHFEQQETRRYFIVLKHEPKIEKPFRIEPEKNFENALKLWRLEVYRKAVNYYKSYFESIQKKIRDLGGKIIHEIYSLGLISAELKGRSIQELSEIPWVKEVIPVPKVRIDLNLATKVIGAQDLWEMGLNGSKYNDSNGAIEVAVVDTGVNANEPTIIGKVIDQRSFVSGENYYDYNGHGTIVSIVIASASSEYRGVAPGVNIINAKAISKDGTGSADDVIRAVEWALTEASDPAEIINLSLGTFDLSPDGESFFTKAIDELAFKYKAIIVSAVGNAIDNKNWVNVPADGYNVIAVGAMDDHNTLSRLDDTIASFSCKGPTKDGRIKPDLVAPGVNIEVPYKNALVSVSGTSLAAPMISGSAALLMEWLVSNQSFVGDVFLMVKSLLVYLGEDRGSLGPDNTYGFGYIDLRGIIRGLFYGEIVLENNVIMSVDLGSGDAIEISYALWREFEGGEALDVPSLMVSIWNASGLLYYTNYYRGSLNKVEFRVQSAGTYYVVISKKPQYSDQAVNISVVMNKNFTVVQNSVEWYSNISDILDSDSGIFYFGFNSNTNKTISSVTTISDLLAIKGISYLEIDNQVKILVEFQPKDVGVGFVFIGVTTPGEPPIIGAFSFNIFDDDFQPPDIIEFKAIVDGTTVTFEVKAEDESGIGKAYVDWSLEDSDISGRTVLQYNYEKDAWVGELYLNTTGYMEAKLFVWDNDSDRPNDSLYSTKTIYVTIGTFPWWIIALLVILVASIVVWLFKRKGDDSWTNLQVQKIY